MKLFQNKFQGAAVVLAIVCALVAMLAAPIMAVAATENPAQGAPGYMTFNWLIAGQRTASQTAVIKHVMPYPCRAHHASATARASGGTSPTLTVTIKQGATTLSAVGPITAGTVAEGTLSSTAIPDEAVVTIDTTIGGTSPTWDDISILMTCKRL